MYPVTTDNSSASRSSKIVLFHHYERGRHHDTELVILFYSSWLHSSWSIWSFMPDGPSLSGSHRHHLFNPQCLNANAQKPPNPSMDISKNRYVRPVSTALNHVHRRPDHHHRSSPSTGVASAPSIPLDISVQFRIAPIAAGSAWAISAPTAILAVNPGASCNVYRAKDIFMKHTARSSMVSALHPTSSSMFSPVWLRFGHSRHGAGL